MSADLVYDLEPPAPGRPLLVVLHGLGDDRRGWRSVVPMLGLAGWGVCYAQAPDPYGDGWSWFDIDLGPPLVVDAAGVARSHRCLVRLLAELAERTATPPSRIALLGFSQGGLLTLEVALRHAEPLLAAVCICGWLHRAADWPAALGRAAAAQRLLCLFGRYDPLVPPALARPPLSALARYGVRIVCEEHETAHGVNDAGLASIRRWLLDAERAEHEHSTRGGTHEPTVQQG